MKLIIAGGRNYRFTEKDIESLDGLHKRHTITEVVSGGASGADKCGEEWAYYQEIPVTVFKADWDEHGKSAGPIRNKEMAKYADACVLFPGGKGTDNMWKEATSAGIPIFDWRWV